MNRKNLEAVAQGVRRLSNPGVTEAYPGQFRSYVASVMATTFGLSLEARAKFLKQCGVPNGHSAP